MSKSENRGGSDRTKMENMSTASLEELLLEDFHAPEFGRADMADMDDLYMAAQALSERDLDPQAAADRAWERFQKNYLPFAAVVSEDGVPPSSDDAEGRHHSLFHRWPVRVALAVAALFALLLSISAAAAANGRDWLSFLALWTDEQIWLAPGQVEPAGKDEIHIPEEGTEFSSLQEALDDCDFTRPVVPQWLPEGFVLDNLVVDTLAERELLMQAGYRRGEDYMVMMVVIYLDDEDGNGDNHANFQKDEGDPIPYEVGGITHLLATNAGRPVAVWANGPAECALSGDITMEELKQIINSIYE